MMNRFHSDDSGDLEACKFTDGDAGFKSSSPGIE